jgi:chemotaxis protein methyltransferase CheR
MGRAPRFVSPAAAAPVAPTLSGQELQRFCDFLHRRTGMLFGESKRYYIDRRLAERMASVGAASFAEYFGKLQTNDAEIERLINSFTVNETYFYREEHQLRCLGRSLLGAIVENKGPGDLVRMWSVPCSTGEEPYSIAIWLLENWPRVDVYHIEIVGSDIDTRALRDAQAGLYGDRAVARLPEDVLQRYFEPAGAGGWRILQDIRESVTFTKANLVDTTSMASQGRFDVIFCRNVLIYFDEQSRLKAADNLFDSLNPGGFICLGHSESMARISDRFEMCRFDDAIVYRKPEG